MIAALSITQTCGKPCRPTVLNAPLAQPLTSASRCSLGRVSRKFAGAGTSPPLTDRCWGTSIRWGGLPMAALPTAGVPVGRERCAGHRLGQPRPTLTCVSSRFARLLRWRGPQLRRRAVHTATARSACFTSQYGLLPDRTRIERGSPAPRFLKPLSSPIPFSTHARCCRPSAIPARQRRHGQGFWCQQNSGTSTCNVPCSRLSPRRVRRHLPNKVRRLQRANLMRKGGNHDYEKR